MRLDSRLVAGAGERVLHRLVDLRGDLLRRVLLEDAGLGLEDLPQRPQRDSVAVGEAATLAPRDDLGIGVDDSLQLEDEPALADARNPDERQELRRSLVTRSFERVPDDAELPLASDQLRARLVRNVDTEARSSSDGLPDGDWVGLALRFDGLGVLVVDRMPCCPVGGLVCDDAVDGRCALEASCGVDDVSGRHALTCVRPRVERDERLAGRDTDT